LTYYFLPIGYPLKYTDPDGKTTEIDEGTGVVKNVENDGSNAIVAYPYSSDGQRLEGPGNYIGETMYWDSFISPDTDKPVGVIYKNQSIDTQMAEFYKEAKTMSGIRTWIESRPGGKLDIKSRLPGHERKSYHGFLFDGVYTTLRATGNIFAGMNAAWLGMQYNDFQKVLAH
jgi:filamentous hemagglutinin